MLLTMGDPGQAQTQVDPNLAVHLGDQVLKGIGQWQERHGLRLTLDELLTGGHTSALVAVVVVNSPTKMPSKVILKVCPPERHTAHEPKLHIQALSGPSTFVERHLVTQPYEPFECDGKWRILFQEIAGDSLRAFRPLSTVLNDEALPRLVIKVTRSLLREWNAHPTATPMAPHDLIKLHLGSKLHPNGLLTTFAREQQALDSTWIRFAEQPALVLPNAAAWALHTSTWPDDVKDIFPLLGNAHGDLHPGNILVEVNPTPQAERFRLIDLSAYAAAGPLAKDSTYLCLSIIAEQLDNTSIRRDDLLALALGSRQSYPLELRGLRQTVDGIRAESLKWLKDGNSKSMIDEWADQVSLALVAEALGFIARRGLTISKKLWFYRLACCALRQYLIRQSQYSAPDDPATVPLIGTTVEPSVQLSVDAILDGCEHFTGTRSLIAILAPDLDPRASRVIASYPWTAVISFDPDIDKTGALAAARSMDDRLHRLIVLDQSPEYSQTSTVWYALGGLSDFDDSILTSIRSWRRRYKKTIDNGLAALAKYSSRPVTVIVFGSSDERIRTVVEAVDDRFGERAKTFSVGDAPSSLGEFTDAHLQVLPETLIEALPIVESTQEQRPTVPGHDGFVVLDIEDAQWIHEFGELLDTSTGQTAENVTDVGRGFLQGRLVTWFELALRHDVPPPIRGNLLDRVREDLDNRDTRRISLMHYPGAGGTTLARRIAWEIHRKAPTIYCQGIHDEAGLAMRVSRLSQLTAMPVFVVLEQTTDVIADRFYNRLRSDSVPAVVLVVSRRLRKPADAGPRSFYLGYAQTRSEIAALARRYAEYVPGRLAALNSIQPDHQTAVPFYFGLVAFEENYHGIEDYVRRSLDQCTDTEREVLSFIALSHKYAGMSVAADLFSNIFSVGPSDTLFLERLLCDSALALLVEESPGYWRTSHWLVATEILRQTLAPAGGRKDDWQINLSGLASKLIREAYDVFHLEPPDDIRNVLEHLFIVRENREVLGVERLSSFSKLIEDVPAYTGRIELLRLLSSTFSNNAHYWAHLGRLLSLNGDHTKALEAANEALDLETEDNVLYHIRGMIYSRQLRSMTAKRDGLDEESVRRIVELALKDFDEAARREDDSEYPHVASAQLAIFTIENARERGGFKSFAEFLTHPSSTFYRSLLITAESALAAIAEINGPDEPSAIVQGVTVSLQGLYDDYSSLLQGWRNLLDRNDVVKPPIRSRLVAAYVRRAGSWAHLKGADRRRVMSLLEDNLRDNPTDPVSLRDWLRAARMENIGLDRAGELVSYWAARSRSRDALFYDYVLSVLMIIGGRESERLDVRRKLEKCRDRAKSFANRKFSYEWLGHGDGLNSLVHYSEVPDWDRDRSDETPAPLRRVTARVARIDSPQAGALRLEDCGIEAFFVPSRVGLIRNRHENARVDVLLGFSYDGLRAWSVRHLPTEEP